MYFRPVVRTNPDDKLVFFSNIIDNYLKEEQNTETYIEMLKDASRFFKNYAVVEREMILEDVRKQNFPNLPSRKNSIWLSDKDQLDFWREKLNGGQLFKVNVSGELFKSSDYFLPDQEMSILEAYEQAKNIGILIFLK